MFEKEIEIIKKNNGTIMYVNLPISVKCTVIGYGILPNILNPENVVLKVLLKKHNPSGYKFPWQTELEKYILLTDEKMNPDDFIAVPYNCIKMDKNEEFLNCY